MSVSESRTLGAVKSRLTEPTKSPAIASDPRGSRLPFERSSATTPSILPRRLRRLRTLPPWLSLRSTTNGRLSWNVPPPINLGGQLVSLCRVVLSHLLHLLILSCLG